MSECITEAPAKEELLSALALFGRLGHEEARSFLFLDGVMKP